MNPLTAAAAFTTTLPLTATVPMTAITPTTTTPVTATTSVTTSAGLAVTTSSPTIQAKIFTPDVIVALQSAVFNNFTDLGLQSDIQELASVFFANLPAVPPAVTPITPNTPTTPTTLTLPTVTAGTGANPASVIAANPSPVAPIARACPLPAAQATPANTDAAPARPRLVPDILAALQAACLT